MKYILEFVPHNLEVGVDVAAPPERVWAVVADLERIPEFSPLTMWVKVFGSVRDGAMTVNLNHDGWRIYPTTSRIVRFEPNRELAFRVPLNGSIWTYTLEPTGTGTRLTERRDVSGGLTRIATALTRSTYRSEDQFEGRLLDGMHRTLAKIKAAVEGSS